MQRIEPYKRILTYLVISDEHELHEVANERRRSRANHVYAYGYGPQSQLVPRKQITSVAQQESEHKQYDANYPVKLSGRSERAGEEHATHVEEHRNYCLLYTS